MLTLLRVARVYTPQPSEATDILFADGRIAYVGPELSVPTDWPVAVYERPDCWAVPGFIDQHVHVTGGGGEGGPVTRCPEITARQIAERGIATVVGLLGTDGISRSPADVLAKVRGLRAEGVDAYMYTGNYRVPPPTLTGSVQRDLAWVPEILGVGEIALSDHRSSQPTFDELARLVADARVGGMLAGKRGICHFHMGDGSRGLELLRRLLSETEIPAEQVIPTHVNRIAHLIEDAADYAKTFQASVDVTAFDGDPGDGLTGFDGVRRLLERGVPAAQITLSSDCQGSLPEFDAQGRLTKLSVASNGPLLSDWQTLVRERILDLADALPLLGANVARVLGLHTRKGQLVEGFDADVTLLDEALNPCMTFSQGREVWSHYA
ncbi:beta-aspartyl-peptidase [Rhodovibrio salinarum]|uniref:Isoaspartyl dipeptidase n=2 Tax=Rhodovibrio salinarum TaxID=1087 RepID=A0A934QJL3_9PROT|nr:beta-aspartyl-peptidase [Rhodovibrio salinarum]